MFKKLTLIAALGFAASANAGMISDYSLDGNVVKNAATGFEWLQWTETTGMAAVNAVSAYSADGWRLATSDEMESLYSDFFPKENWEYKNKRIVEYGRITKRETAFSEFTGLFGATYFKNGTQLTSGTDYTSLFGDAYNDTRALYQAEKGGLSAAWVMTSKVGTRNKSETAILHDGAPNILKRGIALIRESEIIDPEDGTHADVSEPGTLALMGLGLAGLAATRKQVKSNA